MSPIPYSFQNVSNSKRISKAILPSVDGRFTCNSLAQPASFSFVMWVNVTEIDDLIKGRQGPCVSFSGITSDVVLQKSLSFIINLLEKE